MKCGIVALTVAAMLFGSTPCFRAEAAEAEHPKVKHGRQHQIPEMTFTGKIVKDSWRDKDGNPHISFHVETPMGDRIHLSTGVRAEDGQPTLSQLEKFANQTVTIVGKGYSFTQGEKTTLYMTSVTRITVIDPDAGK